MSGEKEAFLRRICESPDDDAPRLIYADWLDERGDSDSRDRAEFIRVQIKLARMDGTFCLKNGNETKFGKLTKHCRCSVCKLRRVELASAIRRHGIYKRWQEMPTFSDSKYRRLIPQGLFHRGFVEVVQIPLAGWLQIGTEIILRHPVKRVTTEKIPAPCGSASRNGQVRTWHEWFNYATYHQNADELPETIFNALPRSEFPTRQEALDALSDTLLNLARTRQLQAA